MDYYKHQQALVDDKAKIGDGTRIWAFTNIQGGAVIGRACNICDGCFIESGAVVGDHVTIKHHVAVFKGVKIENDVFVGSNVAFINDRRPRSHRQDTWVLEETLIGKGATLGSNSTVICGNTVGVFAVVGAGSVVTKDVPAYTIVCGNPAQKIGFVCYCGQRLDSQLKCACGKSYSVNGQGLEMNE